MPNIAIAKLKIQSKKNAARHWIFDFLDELHAGIPTHDVTTEERSGATV